MFGHQIDRHLVSVTDPTSMEAEQYQTLRLKIERFQRERDLRVVAITSPGARDGKSVTAINLAASLARGSNARVLLIEADIRRPAMSRYLGLNGAAAEKSLSKVLSSEGGTLQDGVQRFDSLRFDMMLAGTPDVPVTELLRSPRVASLLNEAREQYDYVLIDTPPLNLFTDAALIGAHADATLLVARADRTERQALKFAVLQLQHVQANLAGAILNGVDLRRNSRYRGGYDFGRYGAYYA